MKKIKGDNEVWIIKLNEKILQGDSDFHIFFFSFYKFFADILKSYKQIISTLDKMLLIFQPNDK